MTLTNDHRTKTKAVTPAQARVRGVGLLRLADGADEERSDKSCRSVWPRSDWATEFDVHEGAARRYRTVEIDGKNRVVLSQRAELTLRFDGVPAIAIDEPRISIHQDGNAAKSWLTVPEARLVARMPSDQHTHVDLALRTHRIPVLNSSGFKSAVSELLDAYDGITGAEAPGLISAGSKQTAAVTWAAPAWATSISYEGPATVDRDGVPCDLTQWFGLLRETETGYLSAEGCLDLNPDTHTLTFEIEAPKLSYDIQGWPGSPEVSIEEARSLVAGDSDSGVSDLATLTSVRETLRQLLDAYDAAAADR